MTQMRPVKKPDGKWVVVDKYGRVVGGPFDTQGEVWAWIDENTPKEPP